MKLAALFLTIIVASTLVSGCGSGATPGNAAGADARATSAIPSAAPSASAGSNADATSTMPASAADSASSQATSDASADAETTAASTGSGGIPAPAQCYVDAVNQKNLDALVTCFALDAVIIDVSRRITGAEAIRRWADNEVIGGTLEVVEIAEQREGHIRLLVHWAPEGSSGWRAYYTFDYRDGRITEADLQYA